MTTSDFLKDPWLKSGFAQELKYSLKTAWPSKHSQLQSSRRKEPINAPRGNMAKAKLPKTQTRN